ncbi:hypothetical protein I547_4842 [Mycobacterium kansasii 824]|nr:hypothetical protein I547_4842 [Mycobacterium kansasii 824]
MSCPFSSPNLFRHAVITVDQAGRCRFGADQSVRAIGDPGHFLHHRNATQQQRRGAALHLRASGHHLGGRDAVSGVQHRLDHGKFGVAGDPAASRPDAPRAAVGDCGGSGCAADLGCGNPMDRRLRRGGVSADHSRRRSRHRGGHRCLYRHGLQQAARKTPRRTVPDSRCRGIDAGHRRHAADSAHAGQRRSNSPLPRSAVAGCPGSDCFQRRCAARGSHAVRIYHRPPAASGNLSTRFRGRPGPAVVSPVRDDVSAVRPDLPGNHVLQPARRKEDGQFACAGGPVQRRTGRRFGVLAQDLPSVRSARHAAGQRTVQHDRRPGVHRGGVVRPVVPPVGVRHGFPAGDAGRPTRIRRVGILDQRVRRRAAPRDADRLRGDVARHHVHPAGRCPRHDRPKTRHRLAGRRCAGAVAGCRFRGRPGTRANGRPGARSIIATTDRRTKAGLARRLRRLRRRRQTRRASTSWQPEPVRPAAAAAAAS